MVKGYKTDDLQHGDARLAWTRLSNKFESKTTLSLIKLKKELTNSKFQDHDDPDEWITSLEEIQKNVFDRNPGKTEHHISNESLMIFVMNVLPREYDIEKNKLEKDLEADTLDITNLRLKLTTRFDRLQDEDEDNNDKDDQEESEMSAYEGNKKKQFKGRCNLYGEYGHKATNYKYRKNPPNKNEDKTN